MYRRIEAPRRQHGSYVAGIALVLSVVALGLWFFQPAGGSRTAGTGTVTVLQAREAPAESSDTAAGGSAEPGSYRHAVEKAAPSVVNVYTAKRAPRRIENPLFRYFYGDREPEEPSTALGSGVIMSEQGYILTNNHVVEGADQIAVASADGEIAEARVVGTDPETDLAVLRVNGKPMRPIAIANASSLHVGDVVLAIGNPFGVGQTVTQGIVSATGRNRLGINTFENFIQTDAAINPGNSGGALVDSAGNLVGINTAIFSQSGGSQGIGFAIPANVGLQVMKQIIEKGTVIRGWLGVEARDVAASGAKGALVAQVQANGPAARAGLRSGDVIVAVNGERIADSGGLMNKAAELAPGSTARLGIVRAGQESTLAIEVGQRPPSRRKG